MGGKGNIPTLETWKEEPCSVEQKNRIDTGTNVGAGAGQVGGWEPLLSDAENTMSSNDPSPTYTTSQVQTVVGWG